MNTTQVSYLIFGIVLVLALLIDLGLLSRKNSHISIKKALWQTVFWVGLSIAFCIFLLIEKNAFVATKYLSAYLMEWSLSIDNIFVFILIFSYFKVQDNDTARALLIGILLAILFRIIFIAIGIELIERFHWLLYLFGAFLVYTGYKLFFSKNDHNFNPADSRIYKFMQQFLRVTNTPANGKYLLRIKGKVYFTSLTVVVLMLAGIDIVFALDSIPTVVSLVRERADQPFTEDDIMVIYSSNIFAVLGLRSLFFLLQGAVNKFAYLQQGIAVVLVFIGFKMLVEYFDVRISIYVSLGVIIACLLVSILYSVYRSRPEPAGAGEDASI